MPTNKLIMTRTTALWLVFVWAISLQAQPSDQRIDHHMDTEHIIQTIQQIFINCDGHRWEAVENSFAEQVTIDYSSLDGAPASVLALQEITGQWQLFLPGFYATHHQVGDFSVTTSGNTATAHARGTARHYLPRTPGGDRWIVKGSYTFELSKTESGDWKVSRMAFHVEEQSGNLKLPQLASERAQTDNRLKSANTGDIPVTTQRVAFESAGVVLAGTLYLPADFTSNRTYPAAVVTGSWTTVKEQMAAVYARKLAERGLVALVFDFRNYGERDGEPRNYESPRLKTQDIGQAAAYLASLPFIDSTRIGGLAVCASSGYMAQATVDGTPIRRLTFVAPWLHDEQLVHDVYGGEEGVSKRLAQSREARTQYERDGTVRYVPTISETDPEAAMHGPFDYYLDPDRGAIPEWESRFAVMSGEEWLTYRPIPLATRLQVPVLIVHSRAAAIPMGAERFHALLPGEKRIVWIEQPTPFDFYDQEPYTTDAADLAANWFTR